MKRLLVGLLLMGLWTSNTNASDIEKLSWMTGTWIGQFGTMELEETWNSPKAGSIQALVRMMSGEQMLMVEMIVIEEHEDSLRLRIQQWDPGMEPRESGRQTMQLVELEDEKVSFETEDEGPLKKLTYQLSADKEFEITVVNSEDQEHKMKLKSATDGDDQPDSDEDDG